jgi:hypothetical protein
MRKQKIIVHLIFLLNKEKTVKQLLFIVGSILLTTQSLHAKIILKNATSEDATFIMVCTEGRDEHIRLAAGDETEWTGFSQGRQCEVKYVRAANAKTWEAAGFDKPSWQNEQQPRADGMWTISPIPGAQSGMRYQITRTEIPANRK